MRGSSTPRGASPPPPDVVKGTPTGRWLLLFHQIPPKPDYFRVKVWRRLQRIGAVPVKNSVWVLPYNDQAVEDFRWLLEEIEAGGGEGSVCRGDFVDGLSDRDVEGLFRKARAADYAAIVRDAKSQTRKAAPIDAAAQFKFVAPEGYSPRKGELRFDMFEAEYTHEGDRCTFETLVRRFRLRDPALRAIGEIVHDIDCKDAKFGRAEATGIERLLAGIARKHATDATRLRLGAAVFDNLYQSAR